tara:strand:+ start:2255 stop:7213 length:4959 start_codon:yes stop_codon:yes gene_type:complete
MTSPFTWTSSKSNANKNARKTSKVQHLQRSIDSVFNNTFDPEGNRYDWFYYLRNHPDVSKKLNIVNETDISLMMPPINNIDLPLLDELRESLIKLNPNAMSYPYSSRCASDVKNLVNDYESCINEQKNNRSNLKVQYRIRRDIQLEVATIKKKIIENSSSLTIKQRLLGELSNKWKNQKKVEKSVKKLSDNVLTGEKECNDILNKLEKIFKAKPNWKLKNMKGESIKNEIFDNSVVLNGSILLAIEEMTRNLKPVELDIHPVPYKNMLIIPKNTENLPPKPWNNIPKPGLCKNRIKIDTTKQTNSVALESSWDQFATFDVPEYQNKLQQSLNRFHGVELKAKVIISFDPETHSIVPDVPWWSNKNDVGVKNTVVDGNVTKNTVGFVWQYKIPTHSRMSLDDTPWVNALETDGEPMQMFNLPKNTSNYAVQLCFIKPNAVVPLSNVLYGRDVQRHMKQIIEVKRKTSNPLKLNFFDVKRLTMKARAILGITDMSRKRSIENEVQTMKNKLQNDKTNHDNIVKNLVVQRFWNRFLQDKINETKYSDVDRQNAAFRVIVFKRNIRKQRSGMTLAVGALLPSISTMNAGTFSDPDNVVELANFLYMQKMLLNDMKLEMQKESIAFSIVSKDGIKLQRLTNELKSINVTNNSTSIHAPGLIRKSRDELLINNFIKNKRWTNPWTDDLPEECCIALEPSLAKYEYDIQLEKLNLLSLRASNYDSSVAVADVNGELLDESDWETEQKKSFSLFNNATRKLQPIEKQIQKWNSMFNNITKTSLRIQAEKSVLQDYNIRLNDIKNLYDNDIATLETELENASNDLSNTETIIDAELVKASQSQLQALLQQIQDAREEERDANEQVEKIKEDIKDKRVDLATATGGQQAAISNEIANKRDELKRAQKEADDKKKELLKQKRKRLEEEEKIRRQKAKELKDAKIKVEQEIKKREEAYKREIKRLEEQERKEVESKIKEAERLEQLIGKESKSFTLDFNEGLVDIKAKNAMKTSVDWIYPADLKYGGGYFTKDQPDIVITPYGFYTMGNKKIWSGLRINEESETPGYVKLYDENQNLVEVNKQLVYPVLNDNIYIQGDTPTTSIKKLTSANDSDKLGYFGLNGNDEQITFELPYALGTTVGFTYKVPSPFNTPVNVYDKILQYKTNLKGKTDAFKIEQYSTGIIEEVHVINSKTVEKMVQLKLLEDRLKQYEVDLLPMTVQSDIIDQNKLITKTKIEIQELKSENGVFKNGEDFETVLVANVRINDNLLLEDIPFKFLHRTKPFKLDGPTTVCYNDEFRNQKRLAYTFASLLRNDGSIYIVVDDEIIKTDMKNISPIYENGTDVIYVDGDKTSVGEIDSFSIPNYKIRGRGLVNIENVSVLGDAAVYKAEIAKRTLSDGWIESKIVQNYVQLTSPSDLEAHLDYIENDIGLTREIRMGNIKLKNHDLFIVPSTGDDMTSLLSIDLEENKITIDGEILTIDISDTTQNEILTSVGSIPWSEVESIRVPTYAMWKDSAFEFILDPTNKMKDVYMDMMVEEQKQFLIHSGTEGDSEDYIEESGWQSSWPQPKWATSSSSDEKEMALWASSSDTEGAWATSSVSGSVSGSVSDIANGSNMLSDVDNVASEHSFWAESDSEDADDLSSIIAKLETPHSDVAAWATEEDD